MAQVFHQSRLINIYYFVDRPHGGADTVAATRLSLDELQGFMQQLQNLPCVVREADLVQVSGALCTIPRCRQTEENWEITTKMYKN